MSHSLAIRGRYFDLYAQALLIMAIEEESGTTPESRLAELRSIMAQIHELWPALILSLRLTSD